MGTEHGFWTGELEGANHTFWVRTRARSNLKCNHTALCAKALHHLWQWPGATSRQLNYVKSQLIVPTKLVRGPSGSAGSCTNVEAPDSCQDFESWLCSAQPHRATKSPRLHLLHDVGEADASAWNGVRSRSLRVELSALKTIARKNIA